MKKVKALIILFATIIFILILFATISLGGGSIWTGGSEKWDYCPGEKFKATYDRMYTIYREDGPYNEDWYNQGKSTNTVPGDILNGVPGYGGVDNGQGGVNWSAIRMYRTMLCIQKERTFNIYLYGKEFIKQSEVTIDGNRAYNIDANNKLRETYLDENAIVAHLFNQVGYQGAFDRPSETDITSNLQKAVWHVMYNWAVKQNGILHNVVPGIFEQVNDPGNEMVKKASAYAQEIPKGHAITENYKDRGKVVSTSSNGQYIIVGPFNYTFPGSECGIEVSGTKEGENFVGVSHNNVMNEDGTQKPNNQIKPIQSGQDCYLYINKDFNINTIKRIRIHSFIEVFSVKLKFYTHPELQHILYYYDTIKTPEKYDETFDYNIILKGNLEITKVNKQNNDVKMKNVKFKIKQNKTGKYVKLNPNERITYTDNINESGTNFITNSEGKIKIKDLLVGEYTAYEVGNDHYGYEAIGNEGVNVKIKEKENYKKIENNQKYIKLSGYVWEDKYTGKTTNRNNIYGSEDGAKIENIRVKLKKGTNIIKETLTDKNGKYIFNEVLISELNQYNIEFEYDGLIYTNVTPKINDSGIVNEATSQLVNDGIYTIRSSIDTQYVLDVSWASKENGENIQICTSHGGTNQQFKIECIGDQIYTITAVHSGKAVDVANAGTTSGTNVQQYQKNGSNAQKWKIIDVGNGEYSFQSLCGNLYLDLRNANATNGENIHVFTGNNTKAQKWKLELLEEDIKKQTIVNGQYEIKSLINQEYKLDVENSSLANGANIQIAKGENKTNQNFELKYLSNGDYNIKAVHSDKILEAKGTIVQQEISNNTDSQKWKIKYTGDGYYNIISKTTGKYLDVENGNVENGKIKLNEKNESKSQIFKFEKMGENTSKAKEIESDRERFNNKFNPVENYKTQREGITHGGPNKGGESLIYNKSPINEAHLVNDENPSKTYNITANTKEANCHFQNYFRYGYVEEIENINLGIYKREQPDLATIKELKNAKITINGNEETYYYNKILEDNNKYKNEFNMAVKFKNKRGTQSYTREVYPSDVKYTATTDPTKELQIYATYGIQVINESTEITAKLESLAEYYDSNYDIEEVGLKLDEKGNVINEDYKARVISTENKGTEFKKSIIKIDDTIINPLNLSNDTQYQEAFNESTLEYHNKNSVWVYVKFKVNKEAINKLLSENEKETTVDNIAEINSYSSWQKDKDGILKTYAGIDKDSAPGNIEPSVNDGILNTYEDDTALAPAFKIVKKASENVDREIKGSVFEDNEGLKDTIQKNELREGDGIYNKEAEHGIGNVGVTLKEEGKQENKTIKYITTTVPKDGKYGIKMKVNNVEIYKKENNINKIQEDSTVEFIPELYNVAEDTKYVYIVDDLKIGDYFIKGFIPSNYKIIYNWGGQTYTSSTNTTTYNVQDYKGTKFNKIVHGRNPKYLYGDINLDGVITKDDAIIVLNHSVKITQIGGIQKILADVDGDGEINASDGMKILEKAEGKITIFPVGNELAKTEFEYIYGDVNMNGVITKEDSDLVLEYSAKKLELKGIQKTLADVDENGVVNTSDSLLILRKIAGEITSFPVGNKIQTKSEYIYGDINLDGVINKFDIEMVTEQILGKIELTPIQKILADLNRDGEVSIVDATYIQNIILGKLNNVGINELVNIGITVQEYMYGDVNMNGNIDEDDFKMIGKQMTGEIELTIIEKKIADVNGDGEINIFDMLCIQNKILGKGDSAKVGEILEYPIQWYKDYIYGDVNFDGSITEEDYKLSKKITEKIIKPTEVQKIIGDLNNDNKTNILDTAIIGKMIKGEIKEFPTGNLLEHKRYSDAVDNWEIRKNIDKEIRKTEESGKTNTIFENTKMNSTTPVMHLGIEYGPNDRDRPQLYGSGNYKYKIKNIDFGIIERPRMAINVDKKISHIKLILANGIIYTDADIKDGALIGPHIGVTYIQSSKSNPSGTIKIELDKEIVQGANLEITYKIEVENTSEKDYFNKDFYRYGSSIKNIEDDSVTITVTDLYDYLDKSFGNVEEANWQTIKLDEYNKEVNYPTKLERNKDETTETATDVNGTTTITYKWKETGKEITGNETQYYKHLEQKRKERLVDRQILRNKADELKNKILKPAEKAEQHIVGKKVLTTTEEISLENTAEVTRVKQNFGRVPSTKESSWESEGQKTIVVEPTGENKNLIPFIITVISSLGIFGIGVVFIKNKILKK